MTHPPHKAVTKVTMVTMERLAQLLDAYGGDPSQWPQAERAAAQQLLETNAEAQKLRARALQLDAALDLSELPDPATANLRARVLEIPIRHAHAPATVFPRFGWKTALFALSPCVLGFLSGNLLLQPASETEEDAWEELAQVDLPAQISDELAVFDEETP
jgi:hypothetical protein